MITKFLEHIRNIRLGIPISLSSPHIFEVIYYILK